MAAVDFLSVQEDVDSDKIGIIGICGRLTHAYFHLIPLNPLEFGGIFYAMVAYDRNAAHQKQLLFTECHSGVKIIF